MMLRFASYIGVWLLMVVPVWGQEAVEEEPLEALQSEQLVTAQRTQISMGENLPSILYMDEDINMLRKVLSVYELDADYDLSSITPIGEIDTQTTEDGEVRIASPLPNFYFSSMIYRNASDWAAWINGQRYSPQSERLDFKVELLEKDLLQIAWKPEAQLPEVIEIWQKRNERTVGSDITHRTAIMSKNVMFNITEGVLTFTLRPNQTFVTPALKVIEGAYNSPSLAVGDGGRRDEAMQSPVDVGLTLPISNATPPSQLTSQAQQLQTLIQQSLAAQGKANTAPPPPPENPPQQQPVMQQQMLDAIQEQVLQNLFAPQN